MKKALLLSALVCLAGIGACPAEAEGRATGDTGSARALVSLSLLPAARIPLGESASLYTMGGGAALRGELVLPAVPFLFFNGELGYAYSPLQYLRSLSLVTAALGVGAQWEATPWLALRATASGGAYYGFMNSPVELEGGVYPYLSAGAGVAFGLGPALSLSLQASYDNCLGLYQGISAGIGVALRLGAKLPPAVRITDPRLEDIFPVFQTWYDDHPLGMVLLQNAESSPLTDVSARLQIGEYMEAPKACDVPSTIKPKSTQEIALFGLFKDRILEVTEGTKVPVEVTVEYSLKGARHTLTSVQTLAVLDRNAMTWDDDRKAAAFVTVKDPAVLSFAKNVLAATGPQRPPGIDRGLHLALALHEAVALLGMSYAPDPARPYAETSKSRKTIDYLQFPRQTLEYRAGDCDDLSILTCALLESLNIETAFVTVPGHIFVAFALETGAEEALKTFQRPDDLVVRAGKAWVPVEITETRGGFLDAWQKGAQEWREAEVRGEAAFVPVREAWRAFKPVGLPGAAPAVRMPPEADLLARTGKETARFIEREISSRVARLQQEISASGGSPRAINRLGVLYARYGQVEKAEREFQRIVAREEFVPALVNLGNLALLREDLQRAISYFGRALRREPENPGVLLGLTRAYNERGDTQQSAAMYERLRKVAPDVAERNAYLRGGASETARAGQPRAGERRIEWADD